MPTHIITTLTILAIATLLFISEHMSIDLVALLVLATLAITSLVTPEEALSGFSSPAVVTVWAVFILSAGLTRTGVAGWLGRLVIRFSGRGETRLMLVIMLTSAFLSAFMNNIGVTAMLLPVVLDITRRTGRLPSKLLIPLAFSSLLGGMVTLIGTPPNILAANALTEYGFPPFRIFDFAPLGISITAAGLLYMLLFSRSLLPARDPASELRHGLHEMGEAFAIEERLFFISIPPGSPLSELTLAQSRIGSALSLNVIGIRRHGVMQLAPGPDAQLREGDTLLVSGRLDKLIAWQAGPQIVVKDQKPSLDSMISKDVKLIEIMITENSSLEGKTLQQISFRQKYAATVLDVKHYSQTPHDRLEVRSLNAGDRLLLQIREDQLAEIHNSRNFTVNDSIDLGDYQLGQRLMLVEIPASSSLSGSTMAEIHLGDAYGLGVLGIRRQGKMQLMPPPDEIIMVGDQLLVKGKKKDIQVLQALQQLVVEDKPAININDMETEHTALVEVMLAPLSHLEGKTLRSINFRDKYHLNVLAIWRQGRPWRFNLRDMQLRFGDAILIFGQRDRLRLLAEDPEFLVLTERVQAPPKLNKAPIASILMLAVVGSVGFGFLPIPIAAVTGAALMVLTGCLNMNEAYRAIEWRVVFLIAGMLPLGIALQTSGSAQYLAQMVQTLSSAYGTTGLLAVLFLVTALAAQVIPNPVVTVLMAPVALTAATQQGFSPYPFMMVTAIAASASFLSPLGHPSCVLIMGPGGYKFSDYIKVGLPLMLITLLATLLLLPIFWPLLP